jgi:hypothetical protein
VGLQIEGATGNGFGAGVNADNQLLTAAVMVTKEHSINHVYGQAYGVAFSATPSGPLQCFGYIRNNSVIDMVIAELGVTNLGGSPESIIMKIGDEGTPIGGTVTTPVNFNAGSGNAADVTALSGVNITGLSGGDSAGAFYLVNGTNTERVAPSSGFIIPRNKVVTLYTVAGSIEVRVSFGISFHNA